MRIPAIIIVDKVEMRMSPHGSVFVHRLWLFPQGRGDSVLIKRVTGSKDGCASTRYGGFVLNDTQSIYQVVSGIYTMRPIPNRLHNALPRRDMPLQVALLGPHAPDTARDAWGIDVGGISVLPRSVRWGHMINSHYLKFLGQNDYPESRLHQYRATP